MDQVFAVLSVANEFFPWEKLTILVLGLAAFLDYLIGDPWGWLHPVQVIGWGISGYSQFVLQRFSAASIRRLAGVGLGLGAIASTAVISWTMIRWTRSLWPALGMLLEIILLASCFAGRSLRAAAEDVLQPLTFGDLTQARQKLSLYVGRDTENLSEREILRAILETVSENAVDGVMAPLFYALLGASIPALGPVPLALAYKAASTLDSMVGYREEPYQDLGWFSAKLEDCLTWVPCRLTVITIGLIFGNLGKIWPTCQTDATKDPSPNAGWSECAYAVTLGVQLGGTNSYRGVIKHKPLLGQPIHQISPAKIHQALQINRYIFLTWLGIFCLVRLFFYWQAINR